MEDYRGLADIIKALLKLSEGIRDGTAPPEALADLRAEAIEWAIEYKAFKESIATPSPSTLSYYARGGPRSLDILLKGLLKYDTMTPAKWFVNIADSLNYHSATIDTARELTASTDWDCRATIEKLFDKAEGVADLSATDYICYCKELNKAKRKYKHTALIKGDQQEAKQRNEIEISLKGCRRTVHPTTTPPKGPPRV